MSSTTSPTQQAPRRPRLTRPASMDLARHEYDRVVDALAGLRPEDWAKRTDCTAWDVRQLAAHVIGMAAMCTSPWEMARQQRLADRDQAEQGGPSIDALTALQVREREGRSPTDLVDEARKVAPRAARGRRWAPALVRRLALPEPQLVNGAEERWTVGYLLDVILTRDCWMHRVDLARAAGMSIKLTPSHDGVIVDDVAREWATRHGRSCRLELTGPAGGQWTFAGQGTTEDVRMDAVEFCRTLSGRTTAAGLLGTEVPF